MRKFLYLWKTIPGWDDVGLHGKCQHGDVVCYIPPIAGPTMPDPPDPNTITTTSEHNPKGFRITGLAGKPVVALQGYAIGEGYFIIVRKNGTPIKKEYVPSAWAEPLPLP